MSDGPATVSFESFTLDLRRHAVFRGTERIHLTARPLDVLEHLVANPGRTVTKTELLETVWKDLFVTEDVLVQAVGEIRRALGDNREAPTFVQTVPRVGYRFVATVRAALVEEGTAGATPGRPAVVAADPAAPAAAEGAAAPDRAASAAAEAAATPEQAGPADAEGAGATSAGAVTGRAASAAVEQAPGAVSVRAEPAGSMSAGPGAPGRTTTTTPAHRRRSGRWLAAGLLLVAAAGIVVAVWWRERHAAAAWGEPVMIADVVGQPRMPAFAPDGTTIAFVNQVNGVDQIFVTKIDARSSRQLTVGDLPARRPRWSPRGDQILFALGHSGSGGPAFGRESIWSVPPAGGTPHLVVEDARNPNWSRDGTRIVFERRDEVWIADAEGKNQRRLEGVPGAQVLLADRWPAFSPDGSRIVFFHPETGPQGDLWLVPIGGGSPTRLTFDVCDGGEPVWAPDGRSVVFVSERGGVADLWSIAPTGGTPSPVLRATGENGDPDISSDGRIIFSNTRNQFVLVTFNPETGAARELLERRLAITYPMFSPEGDRLSFFAIAGDRGTDQVFTIGVNGSGLQQVTRTPGERNTFPHWSADGAWLYHYRSQPDLSYRATAATGGPSRELVRGWAWEREYGPRVDARQQRIVYTRTRGGTPAATIVRDIATGREHTLVKALDDPRWSADGTQILGTDLGGATPQQGVISVCSLDAAAPACRAVTSGYMPNWNPDGRSISFLRPARSADAAELWSISLAGTGERKVADLWPIRSIAHFYDVSRRGDIAYVQFKQGRRDLWVAARQ